MMAGTMWNTGIFSMKYSGFGTFCGFKFWPVGKFFYICSENQRIKTMFTIKSIHAETFTDKKGKTAIRMTLQTKIAFLRKERVIPDTVFPDERALGKAIETVNERISPVAQDSRILWIVDLDPLYEKIKSIDESFFTKDRLGIVLFKEVSALIRDMFNLDFLID